MIPSRAVALSPSLAQYVIYVAELSSHTPVLLISSWSSCATQARNYWLWSEFIV